MVMGKKKSISTRAKLGALGELDAGVSRAEVCRKYGVASGQLEVWEEQRERGDFDRDFTQRYKETIDGLYRFVGMLAFSQHIAAEEKQSIRSGKRPKKSKPGNSPSHSPAIETRPNREKGEQNEN